MTQTATADLAAIAEQMQQAAAGFLDSLATSQRDKAALPFGDDETRHRWYYTPTARHGIAIRDLTAEQYQWLRRLMAASLSEAGYNYAAVVTSMEWAVDLHGGFRDRPYGDLPNTRTRDPGNYAVAVFGTPGDGAGWGWTIGGHHLSLHYTVTNGAIAATPAFFGAEPSRMLMPGGLTVRVLAAEEDAARRLMAELNADQLKEVIISDIAATDVVQKNNPRVQDGALYQIGGTGPGGQGLRDKLGLTPEHDERLRYSASIRKGLAGHQMTAAQRETLTGLISAYLSHMPEGIVRQYEAVLSPARLDSTTFAWAGSTDYGEPHYYRVQGDRLLIEYDCTQDNANHTHSVWRDPEGDFGEDLLAGHYASAKH